MSTPTAPHLTATYTSPTNPPFTHSSPLPSLPSLASTNTNFTTQKTEYLSKLRQVTVKMQEVINRELTERMEEDNRRVAEGANGGGKGKVDEKKEEENYGEEVVDED